MAAWWLRRLVGWCHILQAEDVLIAAEVSLSQPVPVRLGFRAGILGNCCKPTF